MTRYYAETPCEHGQVGPHWLTATTVTAGMGYTKPVGQCPGGQRRELTGVEVVGSVGVTFDEMPEGYDGLILAMPSRGWNGPGRYLIIPLEEPADV